MAAELQSRDPECHVVFVGSDRPLEQKLIAAAGYEHVALPVESSRTLLRNPFRFAWSNWRALREARQLIEREGPAGVVGLGGFASVPTVLAAARKNVPTILLEQNAIPGRATRLLCLRAGAVCSAFDGNENQLRSGARVAVTGNPVRQGISDLWQQSLAESESGPKTLLVLGGSQGAESLNEAVVTLLERKLRQLADWQIVHQTGQSQYAKIAESYRATECTAIVEPFFDDMPSRYASATLVVSRAGATTLAELACAGCPAILLPYPHAADNHQLANARVFEKAGAAIIVEHEANPATTADNLARAVAALAADAARQTAMQYAMRQLARPDASRRVVDVLQSLIAGSIQ